MTRRAWLDWLWRGVLVMGACLVSVTVAMAQTVEAHAWWAPVITWSGVVAVVGMVGEWAVRGWRMKRAEQDVARHEAELENLARTVERAVPRDEMERKLERLQDKTEAGLRDVRSGLDRIYEALGAERRKGGR